MSIAKLVKLQSGRAMLGLGLLVAVTCVGLSPSANAFPFGRKKESAPVAKAPVQTASRTPTSQIQMPGQAATPPSPAAATNAAAPVVEPAATPAQRQAARGLDLIAQSQFWMDEMRKNPRDLEAAIKTSNVLRTIGSADRAVQTAAMGIQAHPNDPSLWSALAFGLVADNQNEAALQALQKAITLNPRDARLQSSLGVIYDRLERPDLAATAYQAALAIMPGDSAILSNYGISVAMAGDLPRAEALLRQAVQNPIAPPQARQNLALVVGLQGRLTESEQLASRDVPPATATENIAYLRRMLNGGESRWGRAGGSTP